MSTPLREQSDRDLARQTTYLNDLHLDRKITREEWTAGLREVDAIRCERFLSWDDLNALAQS